MESSTAVAPVPRTPTRAERRRDQRVRRKKQQMLVVAPHLDDAKFKPLLESFAQVTLLKGDCYEFLRKHGLVNEQGELRSSVDTVQRLMGLQLKLANALGLSPAVLGKIRNEKPADLVAALARHGDVEEAEVSSGGDEPQ